MKEKEFEAKFKKAIELLRGHVLDDEKRQKPIVGHSVRVGFYLCENYYSDDVINAGILHDAIEWTDASKELIAGEFGENVLNIIVANTQNKEIKDKVEKWKDMVDRCVESGKEALIVKTADVLDSYRFYSEIDNSSEVDRSTKIGKYILEKLPEGMDDKIFDQLKYVLTSSNSV